MDSFMRAGTEAAALIPEVWSAAFYPYLKEKEPFINAVAKAYQGEIQGLGDTVNILSIPQFDIAEDISEEQKVDAAAVTATATQLVINKQSARDFILTNKALRQSIDAQAQLRDRVMHAIARRMQLNIIAATTPSTSPDHTIAFDSGTTLALADILEAKELLDNSDVEDGDRQMICAVPQYNDIFNITGFVSRDFIPAGSPLTGGAVATPLLGFNVGWTSELTNTVYLFHPMYLQMAVQENPVLQTYDMGVDGYRAQRYNMTALYGVKQVDGLRVVTLA